MRISLLKKREPFSQIFRETLYRYLTGKQERKFDLIFTPRFSLHFLKNLQFTWFGNDYLNFYTNIASKPGLTEVLIKEYSTGRNKITKPFQWFYVHFAVSRIGRIFISQNVLIIKPFLNELSETVILGGNHRLRLLKPINQTSVVILKSGFRNFWIENEIMARASNPMSFCPKIVSTDPNNLWFEEQYCPGTPVNRLSDEECNSLSLHALNKLYLEYIIPVSSKITLNEWYKAFEKKIRFQFSSGFKAEPPVLLGDALTSVLKTLSIYLYASPVRNIVVSKSHGDFQHANILKDQGGNVIVIDWESTAERWVGYDCLTLALKARARKGLTSFQDFKDILLLGENLHPFLSDSFKNQEQLEHFYIIYILEELAYQVENKCEPVFFNSGEGLLEFISDIKREISFLTISNEL